MKQLVNYILEKLSNQDANNYEDIIIMIGDIFDPADLDGFSESLVDALKQINVNTIDELEITVESENNKYDRNNKIKEYKDYIKVDSKAADFYNDSYTYFNSIYSENNLSISLVFEDTDKKSKKSVPFAFIISDSNYLGTLDLYFKKK